MLLLGAASASAANRFAEVGGDGTEPCLASDPCSLETAVNGAAANDDVTLLGGQPPSPYITSTALVIAANVTVHGTTGARPVIQSSASGGPGVRLNSGSALRDVIVDYSSSNASAILLDSGGTLERVTGRTTSSGADGGCGTVNGGTPVIRDSVCWRDGGATANPVGGVAARNDSGTAQTLTLRNVTAISTEEAGIFAIKSDGGALTVNATNTIAFSQNAGDVAHLMGFTPTAINLDHSNYDTETDPGNVITNPGTGTAAANQTTPPVFAAAGDFHQLPTSTGTIDLGVAGIVSGVDLGAADFDGNSRTIGAAPDIGADELQSSTTTTLGCAPPTLILGAGSSTCTATVSDASGDATTPQGSVSLTSGGPGTFSAGGSCALAGAGPDVARCQITYTPSAVGSGSHELTAAYGGDLSHAASQGTAQLGITPASAPPGSNGSTATGKRAAALKRCRRKPKGKKRRKCIKRAKRLPV
jgi:hypothetical protein